ncbi:MAG: alpha/beta hydrolase family esterase [Aeoliella sp.]
MLQKHEFNDRYYLTHTPRGELSSVSGQRAGGALVLAFHGGGSTPLDMARFSGLTEAADRHGFAVVFPAGSGPSPEYLTWNAGSCCGHAARHNVDDVAFIELLLDELAMQLAFDPMRVYSTGMSNGGMFCYRLAAAIPHRIAAIAAVAGCLAFEPPTLARPVPAMHFHGTADEFVPYKGGAGLRSLRQIDFPSVEQTLCRWSDACGLSLHREDPEPLAIRDHDKFPLGNDRSLKAKRIVYAKSHEEETIVEICIEEGGHTWPGQAPLLGFLGKSLLSLSANGTMWDFFERHHLALVP